MLELQLDALAEHVRDLVWTELGAELGLVTCQQGCPEQIRTPDELADALPAILLDAPRLGAAQPHPEYPALEGTVHLELSLLRRIETGEEHPRVTVQQLQKVAALFCQAGFELSGWDSDQGLHVDQIWPADVAHQHDLTYEDGTQRVALGQVTLQAKIVAYDPAG